MFCTTRAAAFVALAALVLGLLVCGATGPSSPGVPTTAPLVALAAVPGCDPGHPVEEGAAGPVVPPRASGFAELLPALAADRTPCGARVLDPGGRGVSAGREPPARVLLSPVELSVLRV
ncbi:hypothetical protein OG259_20040 [Streptomyces sp. NBC_00250]|uniref:hypothetical protein n=1 Tax=Streptomyces sp. NBC_00250 TaxID=2903641 RepID=UPI002E27BC2D|nr:hypothetical protein [Streptomyces sp. NBC_00250]